MYNTVFYIFIGIILFDFVLERTIDYLNSRLWSDELPEEVRDVYDSEKYRKSQEYKKINDKFSILTSSFNLVLILLMLFSGGFAFVDSISKNLVQNSIAITLVFFAILMFCSDVINTPFAVYDTFVIEEKFGFNKTTPKIFIMDKLKGWVLSAIIGGGLLTLFVLFYQATGKLFWIYAWIVSSAFMVFMVMFYSTLIVPIFNKQMPLEEGELKDAIKEFAQKAGFKLDNVFVIDGSKRSSKANAYFSGLGSKKRIVLFDTLINDLTTEEIVAVLAHEIGHYKKKHTLTAMIISIIQTGITLYLLSLFIGSPALSQALGAKSTSFHMGLIAFGLLYSPISAIIGLLMNAVSRKNEYEADSYTKSFNLCEQLISSLKKLSRNNLSNLTPHPAYVFFHCSHPTLLQRIQAIRMYS